MSTTEKRSSYFDVAFISMVKIFVPFFQRKKIRKTNIREKNLVRKINIWEQRNSGKLTFGKLLVLIFGYIILKGKNQSGECNSGGKKIRENVILKIVFGKVHGNPQNEST